MRLDQTDAALFFQLWFGKEVSGEFKEAYMNAKRNHTIRCSISDE